MWQLQELAQLMHPSKMCAIMEYFSCWSDTTHAIISWQRAVARATRPPASNSNEETFAQANKIIPKGYLIACMLINSQSHHISLAANSNNSKWLQHAANSMEIKFYGTSNRIPQSQWFSALLNQVDCHKNRSISQLHRTSKQRRCESFFFPKEMLPSNQMNVMCRDWWTHFLLFW